MNLESLYSASVTLSLTEKSTSLLSSCSNWELTSERWRSSAHGSVLKTLTLWKHLSNQSGTGHQQLRRTFYFCTRTPCLSWRHHQHLALSRPAVCPVVAILMVKLVRSYCLVGKHSSTFQKSLRIRVRLSHGTTWKRYACLDHIFPYDIF